MTPGFETAEDDTANPAAVDVQPSPSSTSLSNSCTEDTGALSDQTIDYAEDEDLDADDGNAVRLQC